MLPGIETRNADVADDVATKTTTAVAANTSGDVAAAIEGVFSLIPSIKGYPVTAKKADTSSKPLWDKKPSKRIWRKAKLEEISGSLTCYYNTP